MLCVPLAGKLLRLFSLDSRTEQLCLLYLCLFQCSGLLNADIVFCSLKFCKCFTIAIVYFCYPAVLGHRILLPVVVGAVLLAGPTALMLPTTAPPPLQSKP